MKKQKPASRDTGLFTKPNQQYEIVKSKVGQVS